MKRISEAVRELQVFSGCAIKDDEFIYTTRTLKHTIVVCNKFLLSHQYFIRKNFLPRWDLILIFLGNRVMFIFSLIEYLQPSVYPSVRTVIMDLVHRFGTN